MFNPIIILQIVIATPLALMALASLIAMGRLRFPEDEKIRRFTLPHEEWLSYGGLDKWARR